MTAQSEPRRVAIACQGGGSHTAFTAGVLSRLLQPDVMAGHRVVGVSGTSGGAICALLAWSALIDDDPPRAADLLAKFWADNSASTPAEQIVNTWMLWAAQLSHYVVTPSVSPYDNYASVLTMDHLRSLLEKYVDFDRVGRSATDVTGAGALHPVLLLGAVDVMSGEFKAFDSRAGEITADAVLASAAIPTLFRSVRMDSGVYWDGLFSQNPPVRELLDTDPDEIWVIQINPKEMPAEPTSLVEIADRRNELAGNLSLLQELHFIEKIDSLIDTGELVSKTYRPVIIRVIEMVRSKQSQAWGAASKLNRDPAFLDGLIEHGKARAEQFVTALAFENAWRSADRDRMVGFFADDAEISSTAPFAERPTERGTDAVPRFIDNWLAVGLRVDPTRKQIAGDTVTWRVRSSKANPGERKVGSAQARFVDGQVVSFRLGPVR
jgi:NTE family protein